MALPLSEINCSPGNTLLDTLQVMRHSGNYEEFQYFFSLAQKVPLISELHKELRDRMLACESTSIPHPNGEPLVLCAISGNIAIGFPSNGVWDRNRIMVEFEELLSDGAIAAASERIDNLTRFAHAASISARHRQSRIYLLRQSKRIDELWALLPAVFAHLKFAPGVEQNLRKINSGHLSTLLSRLAELDSAATEWPVHGQVAPNWRSAVTNESATVLKDPRLRNARVFLSSQGHRRLYSWHARFGSSGRIHLSFDRKSYEVEIGYVGPHLPL